MDIKEIKELKSKNIRFKNIIIFTLNLFWFILEDKNLKTIFSIFLSLIK